MQYAKKIILNPVRKQFNDLDKLPLYDRSLVDYSKYNNSIGHAGVKYSMAVQATRGCPYRCFYCDVYKTTLHHYRESVDSIYEEVKMIADMGVKRIEFIDDIFNVKAKDFVGFFNRVIKDNLNVSFFLPNSFKGRSFKQRDNRRYDARRCSRCKCFNRSASPRMQKVMRKNLNIEKFREKNLEYICSKYPEAVTTLNTMHGFPTETEDEAMMTLNFIQSMKWIHFSYTHIVIFPGTDLEQFALNHGMPKKVINESLINHIMK